MPRVHLKGYSVPQYILIACILVVICNSEVCAKSQQETNAPKAESRRQSRATSAIVLPQKVHRHQHGRHVTSSVVKVRIGYTANLYKRQPYGLNMSEGVKIASFNSGNIVWDYGAQRLVDPALSELIPFATYEPAEQGPVHAVLIPTANLLVPGTMYANMEPLYLRFQHAIQKFNAPVFIVGVGLQREFPGGFSLGTVRTETLDFNHSDYIIVPRQGLLFNQIEQSGGVVAVRGKLTEAVCLANRLPPPVVLGCPSLFINHNPQLGTTLLMKWNLVLQQQDTKNLRLAVGLPHAPHLTSAGQRYLDSNILFKFIADNIFKVFPKSFAVLQTPFDAQHSLRRLREYGVDLGSDRTKYFYDAGHWIEDISGSADFLFSFRIHGMMAGLAAEVPGIVIPTDYRILELAERMALPTVPLQDPLFDMKPFNLFNFMAAVGFNSISFDERRRQLAGEYLRIFDRLGLPLHPGIAALAQALA